MTLQNISLEKDLSREAREDIIELEEKIARFKRGEIPEERFKAFRLTRGVYGQRQTGVQMFRIKFPYGKVTAEQLIRVADISDEYTNGNLHLTTRQNIQLHYVHVEDTPAMWAKLEEKGVTTREACGNTVRNITGSPRAGIDPDEPFNVAPYVEAVFQYFLRNAICQDMGRKIKMAFSASDRDSAYTYFHDFGFIPKEDGSGNRGFKVVVGGGLGAQPFVAATAYEFLPADELIPFLEAAIRVFDRYGEREKRMKARMKFMLDERKGLGLERFLELVAEERNGLLHKGIAIEGEEEVPPHRDFRATPEDGDVGGRPDFLRWKATNTFAQKQAGYFGVQIKLLLGNLSSGVARELAALVGTGVAADDIRFTINQGILLKYVREENLPFLYEKLKALGLGDDGFGALPDITACPGTDTCNLGVTNSTGVAVELEKVIREEYPDLISNTDIDIKISGCMNSCGQHMAASIGFHGSSIKDGAQVIPALQVVLGGGVAPDGKGYIAEKIVKLPTKKITYALRALLDDYEANGNEGEYFNDYVSRQGKKYFYSLLKPLADVASLQPSDYIDWGHNEAFIPEIGTGECAGISYDMVATIINDAQERYDLALKALSRDRLPDAVYQAYSAFVIGAKALLLSRDVHCNTHDKIISDFEEHFDSAQFGLADGFASHVLQIRSQTPTETFAARYIDSASHFLKKVRDYRQSQQNEQDKEVVQHYYKA
ncbi:nitrite reductase [Roseivirga sp. BDSF3-8]|uniref:nitrite reductase n=1 Tax=Roseivirga sp. BDSF3-8 TaxID=3241598 RepID=UPI003531A07E